MRKLLRTRSADQLRSALGTASKLAADRALVVTLSVQLSATVPRDLLPGGLPPARDAPRDLAKLLLAPAPIPLDVHGDVDGVTDGLRRDRRDDLLQGDEVLTTPADERTELRALDLQSFHAGTPVE